MREIRLLLVLVLCMISTSVLLAQGFTYQAVVRNPSNELVTNSEVQIEISILAGSMTGSVEYMENHTKVTNEAGLVTFEIGSVMPASFDAIPWEDGDYYLRQRINPDPVGMPGNYTIESTTKLLSVPYAKYAEKAGRATIADAVVDNGSGMDAFRMPVGSVIPFAGDVAPDGWFICDGRSLDQTQYADLFAVIGNTYGGMGASFNIPDLRGRHPMGKGNDPFADLNDSGGEEEHGLTENELPSHSHSLEGVETKEGGEHEHHNVSGSIPGTGSYGAIRPFLGPDDVSPNSAAYLLRTDGATPNEGRTSQAGKHSHTIMDGEETGNTGSGFTFPILDPYIVLNYIIKY